MCIRDRIIVAQIGAVAQELVDQIAVGAVQLHPVEPGALRIFGSRDIVGNHARNLVEAQRACFFELEPPDRRMRAVSYTHLDVYKRQAA